MVNVKRPALAERLHKAIQQGDLSENADYITAKEEQGFLEGRIQQIEAMLLRAVIGNLSNSRAGRGESDQRQSVQRITAGPGIAGASDRRRGHRGGPKRGDRFSNHRHPVGTPYPRSVLSQQIGNMAMSSRL